MGPGVPRAGAPGTAPRGTEATEAIAATGPLLGRAMVAADPLAARRPPIRGRGRPLVTRPAVEATTAAATAMQADTPGVGGPVRATAHVRAASGVGVPAGEVRPKVGVATPRAAHALALDVRADISGRGLSIP